MLLLEKANAKINLYLHVTGKRNDGYHLLDSLVVFPEVGDDLTLTAAPEQDTLVSLRITGPFAGSLQTEATENNLIVRAAHKLADAVDRALPPVSITLKKNLPVASGIGGGSSDAAAALRLLLTYWDITLDQQELLALAVGLGADIPVCLNPVSQIMSGIGEQLEIGPVMPEFGMILVNHGEAVSTADIFRNRQNEFSSKFLFPKVFTEFDSLIDALQKTGNDLQEPACRLNPQITRVLDAISQLPACRLARMSGSGATCFGLFETVTQARQAAKLLSSRHDWWVWGGKAIFKI